MNNMSLPANNVIIIIMLTGVLLIIIIVEKLAGGGSKSVGNKKLVEKTFLDFLAPLISMLDESIDFSDKTFADCPKTKEFEGVWHKEE